MASRLLVITSYSIHYTKLYEIINEAYNYKKPSSFSRALRMDFGNTKVLLISGTASVNEEGKPEHIGDYHQRNCRV